MEMENCGNGYAKRKISVSAGCGKRLPDGSLTTDGYAARHPVEFRHWGHARGYVLWGERIDRTDWENWRINYYGK